MSASPSALKTRSLGSLRVRINHYLYWNPLKRWTVRICAPSIGVSAPIYVSYTGIYGA